LLRIEWISHWHKCKNSVELAVQLPTDLKVSQAKLSQESTDVSFEYQKVESALWFLPHELATPSTYGK
jgi:hypothetical protein